MTCLIGFLAVVALVPQPTKLVEKPGFCTLVEVTDTLDASVPKEGYRLSITPDGITVVSSTPTGRFYAEQTLAQLKTVVGQSTVYPCVEIEDAPAFPWRGLLLDDSRHFFGKETVMRVIDLMAQHKMNRFHWHLTDDQGWRLDVPGKSELVRYGATRPASVRHGAWTTNRTATNELNNAVYGPFFYTEADIREVIAFAEDRHVMIIPEIELPGHIYSVLAAHPEFACFPERINPRTSRACWGVEKEVLCLGNEAAIRYMEEILDWVCSVFPGNIVHIGGDECPSDRWKECSKCMDRIKAEGLADVSGLHPWLTKRMARFLENRGKRAIGWIECLADGAAPTSVIGMSWRVKDGATLGVSEALEGGYDVVMSPYSYCYLDYRQGLQEDPYQYIGGRDGRCVTLEKAFSFDPCAGVSPHLRSRILGGQAANWSEVTWNEYDLEWKMWPRTCALAEALWTGAKRPSFTNFRERLLIHRRRLTDKYINCAPVADSSAQ